MMEDLVSVILTVYNREKYIKRCIDSIISQKDVNLELIIIDDGSSDNSPEILDEYSKKYENILVIHKKNEGLSAARNSGLDNALGNYIVFMDDDDFLPENALYTLYSLIKDKGADIVIGNYAKYTDDGVFDNVFELPEKYGNKYLSKREACELLLFSGQTHVLVVSWGKIYKKEVWEGLRFPDSVVRKEDQFVLPKVLENSNKIYYTDQIVYNQTISADSITRTKSFSRNDLFHSEGTSVITNYLIRKGFYDIALYYWGVGTRSILDYENVLRDEESVKELRRLRIIFKKLAKSLIPYVSSKNKLRLVLYIVNTKIYKKIQRTHAANYKFKKK